VHPQAVLLEVARLEVVARQALEALVRGAVDVDRILLEDDGKSSARPMIRPRLRPTLPHVARGANFTWCVTMQSWSN
jgi:hypothetical protein